MTKKISAHIISILGILLFLYINTNQVWQNRQINFSFIIFVLPYLLSNSMLLIMLLRSSRLRPLKVDQSNVVFIVSLLASNGYIILGFLNLPLRGVYYDKELALLASLFDLLAIPFYLQAVLNLGKNLTILPEANKLKTTGIYSFTRHPLYITYIYWDIMQVFILQSWLIGGLSILDIGMQVFRAKREEIILQREFPEYNEYRRKVGWIGRKRAQTL